MFEPFPATTAVTCVIFQSPSIFVIISELCTVVVVSPKPEIQADFYSTDESKN